MHFLAKVYCGGSREPQETGSFQTVSFQHPAFLPHPVLGPWNEELIVSLAVPFPGSPLAVPFLGALLLSFLWSY